ncbi:hypothetical protein [Streptomyces griseosporeus]|uniref:hypothetical protein n=1 Tax=Streptomyces griseosporeus TaxID=1910 RepID=UPI0036FC203C
MKEAVQLAEGWSLEHQGHAPGADGPPLAVINQAAEPWRATVHLRRPHVDGTVLAERVLHVEAGPRAVHRQPVTPEPAPEAASATEHLIADAEELRSTYVPVADEDFACPAPAYDVTVSSVPGADEGSLDVVVRARTLVRDLLLQPDCLGPSASRDTGLRALLPGEQIHMTVRGAEKTSANAARAALICVEPA